MPEPEEKDRRLWAKIDVDYFDNAKIDELSDSAQLLHLGLILKAKNAAGGLTVEQCAARGESALWELFEAGLIQDAGPGRYTLIDISRFRKVSRLGNIWQSAIVGRRAFIPKAIRSLVFERDSYRCVYCGSTEKLSIDHIYPWSLGGSDLPSNLQTLCKSCNSKKGAKVGEG